VWYKFPVVKIDQIKKKLTSSGYAVYMRSRWHEYKDEVLALRMQGASMTLIERQFGIARSTLSGWFRSVPLADAQRLELLRNSRDGWVKARGNAVLSHQKAKEQRIQQAKRQAQAVLDQIDMSNPAILDLALSMLYWGEGAKKDATSIGSSDPKILRFTLTVLRQNYGVTEEMVRCDLHLRADQDGVALKGYWAKQLSLPTACFKYIAYDKRTTGKPTYNNYKGVCLITVHQIAIQRKLISLYNLFCDRVEQTNGMGD
jgi:hypothetical protein